MKLSAVLAPVILIFCGLLVFSNVTAHAAETDDVADALVTAGKKANLSPDSLPSDFARLARFVRHEGNGMVLFSDGGATDGYVRHAQARFDTSRAPIAGTDKLPQFSVAFEMVDQPDFTFEGLVAALEQRLGTPTARSDQTGSTFRTWLLKDPDGRSFTVARAQASDNGDPITIVQIMQSR
jgi:hypothetical protein